MGSEDALVNISYWLPVSRVHLTGSVVTSSSTLAPDPVSKPSAAVVTVLTRPDYSDAPCRLTVPADRWMKQHTKIEFLSDGRLSGTESTSEDHRWDGVSSALKLMAFGASIGTGIAGPVGAAAGVAAGALIAVGSAVAADRLTAAVDPAVAEPPAQPGTIDFTGLKIEPGYVAFDRASAEILGRLRQGEASARIRFSLAAVATSAAGSEQELEQLSRQLRRIRAELARAEAEYQKWLDAQVTTTTSTYDLEIDLGQLPTFAEGRDWYQNGPATPGPEHRALHQACRALKVLLTCDPVVETDDPPTDPVLPVDHLRYRPLRPVLLRTWVPATQPTGTTALSNAELQSTQRLLVAIPGHDRDVPAFAGGRDTAISINFDADGALTSVSSDQTGGQAKAAEAVAALPGSIKDAFDAGTDVATPFTAAGRAKALQDQAAEAKARADLAPAADPNQKLEAAVTTAELQARLRAAQVAVTSATPPISVVVVGGASAS